MSEAPERITVTFKNWRNPNQGACYKNDAGDTKYIRADIVQTLTAERDRLRKELENIVADCEASYPPSHGAIKYAAKLALKGESHD